MAYVKKTVQEYITETDDKTVEGFNDNQEDRIASEFDKYKDFVVDQGSNYTKWDSGKVEVFGTSTIPATKNTNTMSTIELPTVVLSSGSIAISGIRTSTIAVQELRVIRSYMPSNNHLNIDIRNDYVDTVDVVVYYMVKGNWK